MLPAVAFIAERLLLAADWREAIDEVLMHLGVAADVSRAYLIRVDPAPEDGYLATQLAEWCAPGVMSQFGTIRSRTSLRLFCNSVRLQPGRSRSSQPTQAG